MEGNGSETGSPKHESAERQHSVPQLQDVRVLSHDRRCGNLASGPNSRAVQGKEQALDAVFPARQKSRVAIAAKLVPRIKYIDPTYMARTLGCWDRCTLSVSRIIVHSFV